MKSKTVGRVWVRVMVCIYVFWTEMGSADSGCLCGWVMGGYGGSEQMSVVGWGHLGLRGGSFLGSGARVRG